MNLEKDCQVFMSSLNKDFTIGKHHLIDDVPFKFTAPDFLYFFSLKDQLWKNIAEDKRLNISLAMTELYVSVLLHIYSGDYCFDEEVHHLENSILYGDLLSGAFAEKLIDNNEAGLLKEWLDLLQQIHKDLVVQSLENKTIYEKKALLLEHLVEYLAPQEQNGDLNIFTKAFLLDGDDKVMTHHIMMNLPDSLKVALKAPISSSGDFLTFIGE